MVGGYPGLFHLFSTKRHGHDPKASSIGLLGNVEISVEVALKLLPAFIVRKKTTATTATTWIVKMCICLFGSLQAARVKPCAAESDARDCQDKQQSTKHPSQRRLWQLEARTVKVFQRDCSFWICGRIEVSQLDGFEWIWKMHVA